MSDRFFTSVECHIAGGDQTKTASAEREKIANAALDALRSFAKKPYVAGLLGLGAGAGAGAGIAMAQRPSVPVKEPAYGAAPGWSDILPGIVSAAGGGVIGGLLGSITRPVGEAIGRKMLSPSQTAAEEVLERVRDDDDYISGADPAVIEEAFSTMQRFAPTLATDPSAVKSFLREAATSGAGVNYNTIKLLAEAEEKARL